MSARAFLNEASPAVHGALATEFARDCVWWSFVGTCAYFIYAKGAKKTFVHQDAATVVLVSAAAFILGSSISSTEACANYVSIAGEIGLGFGAAACVLAVGYEIIGRLR